MRDYLYIKLGAIIGTLLFVAFFVLKNNEIINILSSLILFLTFLAILWYSKETQELKEVSIKRPCLSFNRSKEKIVLKNYGDGVARDIEIDINNEIIYTIPLFRSSQYSGEIPILIEELKKYQGKILISYFDISKKTKYLTSVKWDNSVNNRDGCKIIEYKAY